MKELFVAPEEQHRHAPQALIDHRSNPIYAGHVEERFPTALILTALVLAACDAPITSFPGAGFVDCPEAVFQDIQMKEGPVVIPEGEQCTITTITNINFLPTAGQRMLYSNEDGTPATLCEQGVEAMKVKALPPNTIVETGALIQQQENGDYAVVACELEGIDTNGDGKVNTEDAHSGFELMADDQGPDVDFFALPKGSVVIQLFKRTGIRRTDVPPPNETTEAGLATSNAEYAQNAATGTATWKTENPPTVTPTPTLTPKPNNTEIAATQTAAATRMEQINTQHAPTATPDFPPLGGQP